MATKYNRVNPQEEKLRRLYNCNRMTEDDQKYLNYQFERYKSRNFQVVAISFISAFAFAYVPVVKNSTATKYYSSVIVLGLGLYKSLTYMNNRHYEEIVSPYFEKYKVK